MTEPKKIAIGEFNFKALIRNNNYYVDKTLFIQDILEEASRVLLIPRPRRFGKTLNLSMLQYFLERSEKDHAVLFKGLAISKDAKSMKHQGQYPVISLTFKDSKQNTFEECFEHLKKLLFARCCNISRPDNKFKT